MLPQDKLHPFKMESASMHEDSTMILGDVRFNAASVPTVDTSLYNLSPAQAAFFKTTNRY